MLAKPDARPQYIGGELCSGSYIGGDEMKKLLNTLYITSEDTFLSLDGENVVVSFADDTRKAFNVTI